MGNFLLVLVLVVSVALLIVVHVRTSGVYGRREERDYLTREQARVRQEARDASWEIHRRVSGALTEMMEVARDAQRQDRDQRR